MGANLLKPAAHERRDENGNIVTPTPLRPLPSLTLTAWLATRICGAPACRMSATPVSLIQGISISVA